MLLHSEPMRLGSSRSFPGYAGLHGAVGHRGTCSRIRWAYPYPGGLSSYPPSHLPRTKDSHLGSQNTHPSTIPTASLCWPGTKTCHMDASAHTGTVTKQVTAPVALLLPYSIIYGTFPHLTCLVDTGTMQGVPPHLPAFVSQGRTMCQRVCVSTCVCIWGWVVGDFLGF